MQIMCASRLLGRRADVNHDAHDGRRHGCIGNDIASVS